jgi:hypothetical protein
MLNTMFANDVRKTLDPLFRSMDRFFNGSSASEDPPNGQPSPEGLSP